MTTPHTPPAALDVAAIEARAAAAARIDRYTLPAEVLASLADVPALLRTLAAQHVADVAAAVAGERRRCAALCDAAAARWQMKAPGEAVSSASRRERGNEAAALAAEVRAIVAPPGGGE